MDGIAVAALKRDSLLLARNDSMVKREAWTELDRDKLKTVAQNLAKKRTWVCPTLVFMQSVPMPEETERRLQDPEFRFVRPDTIQMWKSFTLPAEKVKVFRNGNLGRVQALIALHEAGVRLVLGTDSPAPFVPHGFATLRELEIIVDAGLTPYEAIRMATRSAAELVRASGEFGTVAVGGRADLLLIEADPLKDVSNVAKMVGVMLRGRWYPKAEMQTMLDALAAMYARQRSEQAIEVATEPKAYEKKHK